MESANRVVSGAASAASGAAASGSRGFSTTGQRWFLLILILLTVPACQTGSKEGGAPGEQARATRQPTTEGRFVQRQFDTDPVLLGTVYTDSTLGLRFSPPRGWPPLEYGQIEATRRALEQLQIEDERFVSRPVRIFYERDRRLFMLLSEFPNWPLPLDPRLGFREYKPLLASRLPSVQVQDTFFSHGELDFYQLTLSNPVMINTRLIVFVPGRPPVQVDYLTPRGLYGEVSAAIEASVGSIQPL